MRSEFFQALLRSLQDGVVVIDERGTIELINPGLERLLGYTEAELKGRNVSLLMPLHHGARHNDCIQHYLTTGEARIIGKDIPIQALHKDSSLVDAMLSVTEVSQGGHRYFVGRLRDLRPQLRQERELQHLANHDPITGLRNGAALRRTLSETSDGQATHLGALAIIDIERFRIINDTAGHRVGDWLLQQIAQRLVIHAPVNAGVFRWTGDEFVLLLPSAPLLGNH
ncbi:Sensor protein FixL [Tepidimonas thermarum]|uniref:Sensor protein FixL n=1 Tax=Tepidimonas thermarum TaxID=335431 RepID=A0A554WW35_9BURK|nr:GGDEF domain-containing protein [Tepidimonas thermarum]TSE27788.1 Sensor protein FixL [Tepidimonas thermarum]